MAGGGLPISHHGSAGYGGLRDHLGIDRLEVVTFLEAVNRPFK
jgi:hypothetical protein